MFEFKTSIDIAAPADKVWALLTDLAAYPSWNPTVDKVAGQVVLGGKLTVFARIANGKGFPVKVAALEPPRRMVWLGGAPLKFMLKGERTFTLAPAGTGVRFTMHEVFTGLISGLVRKSMPDLQPAFDEFAAALKRRAESP